MSFKGVFFGETWAGCPFCCSGLVLEFECEEGFAVIVGCGWSWGLSSADLNAPANQSYG